MGVDEGGELPDVAIDAAVGADAALDFLSMWAWAEAAEEGFSVATSGGGGGGGGAGW